MSWEVSKLYDLTNKIGSGVTPRGGSSVYISEGVSLIRSQNIYNSNFTSNGLVFVDDATALKMKNIAVQESDVLINITGDSVARCCMIPKSFLPARVNQHVAILRPNKKLNSKFLMNFLVNPNMQKLLLNYAGAGATRNALTKDLLGKMEIHYPPLQIQKRIADILSTYDDLIENNLKRIKLLEQAVQNIYKEWFVNLRFPGYENAIANKETGLPEAWAERNINEVFNIKYGKNLPTTKITSSGKYTVYGASGVMGYYEECNTEIKVALITSRGNGSGDVHRTFQKNSFVTNNSFKVFPKEGYEFYPFFFVTEFLKTLNLLNYCSGSAQPQLTNASMNNIRSIFPNKEMVDLFTQKVSPILEQSDLLLKQNQKLKAARDILLPRIMNRTIEV